MMGGVAADLMHLICCMEVPLPDMPCERQHDRKNTGPARGPVAGTRAMCLATMMPGPGMPGPGLP